MNLNQSAHGDREFGHIVTRMRKNRKVVVVGHWQDEKAQKQIASWMRVACRMGRRTRYAHHPFRRPDEQRSRNRR